MATYPPLESCPLCTYTSADTYSLLLHVETDHSEGESPFVVQDEVGPPAREASSIESGNGPATTTITTKDGSHPSQPPSTHPMTYADDVGDEEAYAYCPQPLCGEAILLSELEAHIEMHESEHTTLDIEGDHQKRQISRTLVRVSDPPFRSSPRGGRTVGRRGPKSAQDDDGSISHGSGHCGSMVPFSSDRDTRSISASSSTGGHSRRTTSKSTSVNRRRSTSTSNVSGISRGWRSFLTNRSEISASPSSSLFSPPQQRRSDGKPHRLGKAELGPYAHEEQMPTWLRKVLEQDGQPSVRNQIGSDGRLVKVIEPPSNVMAGVVPVVAQLCEQDRSVEKAWLCHPCVRHVFKIPKAGGFCGYRNIQMMVSYLQGTNPEGWTVQGLSDNMPSVFELQDLIEAAWDQGYMAAGKIETGGIRGTRKYIGTPEAQALFASLGVPCEARAYGQGRSSSSNSSSNQESVQDRLLSAVEVYFSQFSSDDHKKVTQTWLPPIYFQHRGHSMTIVGFERRTDGSRNLLVFDPMFKPSPGMARLVMTQAGRENNSRPRSGSIRDLLKAYRKGEGYLKKFHAFETMQ
ncbi:MAG: hypothetical protein M1823_000411 [Watsoniomyces obsoletus]|nr:MAG: hypothetical protein M1823_000411 [Watsoniomyces obsoletus]